MTRHGHGSVAARRYRSAIFVHSAEQQRAALAWLDGLAASTEQPVLTEVVRAPLFWRADERHQRYLEHKGHIRLAPEAVVR